MKAMFPWPGLLFLLFAMNFVVVGITVWAAHSDPSFAVEPQYDTRAARWQETKEARARSAALGWTLEQAPHRVGDPLTLMLRDRTGAPVTGATVEVMTFHHAAAAHRREAVLRESTPGTYTSAGTYERHGRWHVAVRARRGEARFIDDRSLEVAPARAVH